jgi:HEAT repeat protein
MSLTYFCPDCWSEVDTATVCPKCGADVSDFAGETYEEKLIRALRHPEPTVPVRAAAILGELGSRVAVEPLLKIAQRSSDPYIQEAAVQALGRIGDGRAFDCLRRLSQEGALRVRAVAKIALETLENGTNAAQK